MRKVLLIGLFCLGVVNSSCPITKEWEFQEHKYKFISDLGKAVAENDAIGVKRLVSIGCDINYNRTQFKYKHWGYKTGYTLLHIASNHGANEALKKLLTYSTDNINSRDEFGSTPVYAAAYWRYSATVIILSKSGANVSIPNLNGATPLYVAAQNGHLHTVKTLVNLGADVNQELADGATPLVSASSRGLTEVVKYLLAQCADIHARGGTTTAGAKTNQTALDWANNLGHQEVVKLLEAQNENEELCPSQKKDPKGKPVCSVTTEWEFQSHKYKSISKLGKAAAENDAKGVKEALTNGCDVLYNKTQFFYRHWNYRSGFTPLHIASTHGSNDAVRKLLNYEDFFHDFINARDELGATPVYAAAYWRYSRTVTILHEAGADISIPNVRGATPLYVAAQNGHLHTVQTLLALGADIDQGKDSGATPLYIAAEQGHVDVVQYLVNLGANVTKHSTLTNKTPLIAARTQGFEVIANILQERQFELGLIAEEKAAILPSSGDHMKQDQERNNQAAVAVCLTILLFLVLAGFIYFVYWFLKRRTVEEDKIELVD